MDHSYTRTTDENRSEAVSKGTLRLCPIYDGYDVQDQNIGLISLLQCCLDHCLFLRTFSKKITLFCHPAPHESSHEIKRKLPEANINVIEDTIESISALN